MQVNYFIQFLNVSIIRNKTFVLKDVNFSIRKGDFIFLLGSTGSGKSSLLEALYAQLPIAQGHLIIDDIPVHKITPNTLPYLRRKIGIVRFDFPLVKNLSIYQNLDLVLQVTDWIDINNRAARIDLLLKKLAISHLKNQKTDQLTKKEYLKVLIARALLNEPAILLLDAPVQHLDVQAAQEVLSFIYQYVQNNHITTFLATVNHKIPKLLAGDKILLCKNNRVNEIE